MLLEDNKQKSKINWLTMEDDCTKFFHANASPRRHINSLDGLLKGDLNSHDDTSDKAAEFYKALYNGEGCVAIFQRLHVKNCKQ